jgi:hypothetical protein
MLCQWRYFTNIVVRSTKMVIWRLGRGSWRLVFFRESWNSNPCRYRNLLILSPPPPGCVATLCPPGAEDCLVAALCPPGAEEESATNNITFISNFQDSLKATTLQLPLPNLQIPLFVYLSIDLCWMSTSRSDLQLWIWTPQAF